MALQKNLFKAPLSLVRLGPDRWTDSNSYISLLGYHINMVSIFIDRIWYRPSVCLSVQPSVCALTPELFDL